MIAHQIVKEKTKLRLQLIISFINRESPIHTILFSLFCITPYIALLKAPNHSMMNHITYFSSKIVLFSTVDIL